MRRHPFVFGYVASSAFLGVLFGARIDFDMALYAGAFFAAAAAIGSFIAAWRPGLEAPAPQLWLMTVAGNPAVLAAVLIVMQTPMCMDGTSSARCAFNLLAWTYLPIAVVAPLIGIAWRWWKER